SSLVSNEILDNDTFNRLLKIVIAYKFKTAKNPYRFMNIDAATLLSGAEIRFSTVSKYCLKFSSSKSSITGLERLDCICSSLKRNSFNSSISVSKRRFDIVILLPYFLSNTPWDIRSQTSLGHGPRCVIH